jgi:hypothetical protein
MNTAGWPANPSAAGRWRSRAEQLLGALDGDRLDLVDEFAAAVVALARIALGVLVGQDRALGLKHGLGDDVLRSDEFDLVLLTTQLQTDPIEDVAVRRGEVRAEEGGQGGSWCGHGTLSKRCGESGGAFFNGLRAAINDGTIENVTRSSRSGRLSPRERKNMATTKAGTHGVAKRRVGVERR